LGVVGEQPLLQPSATFEYASGTVLTTTVGSMHGTYQFTAVDGTQFDVPIPSFTLSMPRVLH
jgi:ApaG protein